MKESKIKSKFINSEKKKVKTSLIINDQRGKVSDSGFWIIEDEKANKQHAFDPNLAIAIKNLILKLGYNEKETFYDLGCGKGDYVKYFNSQNIKTIGFDGNPNTKKFCQDCEIHDLTKPLNKLPSKYVMSLEVAEHIPKDKEYLYIKTLNDIVADDGYLILSWAYPGQGGFGHFNELDNSYCKKLFFSLGYDNEEDYERYLRYRAKLKWFKHTIMVFKKKKKQDMNNTMMKNLYITINEEFEKNILKIKELKKKESSIDFSNRQPDWDFRLKDKKNDLDIDEKTKIIGYFEKIYFNDLIKVDSKIEIINSELLLNDLPSINNLNIMYILKSNKYNKIKLELIKCILKNQYSFIISFPKDFREFIYTKKNLFLRNIIILGLLWYIIFFADFKDNNKKTNYYDLYIEIYKNKFKYSLDNLNKLETIEGFYLFFSKIICESYITRRNTHLFYLMLDLNKLNNEYIKHTELNIFKDIDEPVYTKLLIDIKAYGLNNEKDSIYNSNYINKFINQRVKNLLNIKYFELINNELIN